MLWEHNCSIVVMMTKTKEMAVVSCELMFCYDSINQSINQSILFAQNVQRYTYKAIQLRAGQQG